MTEGFALEIISSREAKYRTIQISKNVDKDTNINQFLYRIINQTKSIKILFHFDALINVTNMYICSNINMVHK